MMGYLEYFESFPIEDIIQACKDDYEWRYCTGKLPDDSIVHKMATDMQTNESEIIEELEYYTAAKLKNIIKLLMLTQTWRFIRT